MYLDAEKQIELLHRATSEFPEISDARASEFGLTADGFTANLEYLKQSGLIERLSVGGKDDDRQARFAATVAGVNLSCKLADIATIHDYANPVK